MCFLFWILRETCLNTEPCKRHVLLLRQFMSVSTIQIISYAIALFAKLQKSVRQKRLNRLQL